VDQVVADLPGDGRLATVTAGWQEREPDDGELQQLLGGRGVNLRLFGRWLEVQERDHELAVAHLEHRAVLDEMHRLYVVQVDASVRALYEVARSSEDRARTRDAAFADALTVVRTVDELHLSRVRQANEDFFGAWKPQEREEVARHRDDVRRVLQGSSGLVVAGGHVGVLLQVLHLFNVAPWVPNRLIAWSAGAMALTPKVVLFHDRVLHGPTPTELYEEGLGLIPGVVLLPHARRRLRISDRMRMSTIAGRYAPDVCVVLDDGVRVDLRPDGGLPAGARVVDGDGNIVEVQAA
jgi:hypothetical protein